MPWKETSVMDERTKFIGRLLLGKELTYPRHSIRLFSSVSPNGATKTCFCMPKNWNIRALRGNAKYSKVYFAFLDILGFKSLMKRHAEKSPKKVSKFFESLDETLDHPQVTGLVKRYLSDSILIWCDHTASLPYLFETCQLLQDDLLRQGHLVRGAIVQGNHFCQFFDQLNIATGKRNQMADEIMISPALIKAYEIERRLKNPVIKVEGAVAIAQNRLLPKEGRPRQKLDSRALYMLPSYFLSPRFGMLRALNKSNPHLKEWLRTPEVRGEVKAIAAIRKHIVLGTRNRSPKISAKWKYVRKMYNMRIRELSTNCQPLASYLIE